MKRVSVVGLGALGSHFLLFARNWPVSFRLVDFDRVESKNIQSQFHSKMTMGRNKSESLRQTMQGMWGIRPEAVTHKLEFSNVHSILLSSDLVVDCTDNLGARDIIQEYVKDRIPCLHGCLSADGTLARIVWTEHFVPDKEDVEGEATCEDGQNLAFHGMAGAMLAQVASRFLELGVRQSWQLTPSAILRLT